MDASNLIYDEKIPWFFLKIEKLIIFYGCIAKSNSNIQAKNKIKLISPENSLTLLLIRLQLNGNNRNINR